MTALTIALVVALTLTSAAVGALATLLALRVRRRPAVTRPKPRTGGAGTGPTRAVNRTPHHPQPPAHPRAPLAADATVKVPVVTRPIPAQSPLATRRQP